MLVAADPSGDSKPVVFEIPQGATGNEVARALEKKGLIRSALSFRAILYYKKKSKGHVFFKSGFYKIDPGKPAIKIFEQLIKGEQLTKRVTIPEGLTLRETAALLDKNGICSQRNFIVLAEKHGKEFGSSYPVNLEGYVFPDTYSFPWKTSARQVIATMLSRFDEITAPMWKKYGGKNGLDFYHTLILASMVEKEAQLAKERPLIAGVYINRLRKGMLLQCDATVQYALGRPHKILTLHDLKYVSPYNTYKYPGLPPGPICNPGKDALLAAMKPKDTLFLFYVRNDVKNDGSHVFTKSFSEHQDAIRKYQR